MDDLIHTVWGFDNIRHESCSVYPVLNHGMNDQPEYFPVAVSIQQKINTHTETTAKYTEV